MADKEGEYRFRLHQEKDRIYRVNDSDAMIGNQTELPNQERTFILKRYSRKPQTDGRK